MRPILSLILSTLVFFAMILALVLKPTAARRLSTVFMTIGVIGGLLIYGIGYTEAFQGDLAMTVIRTPMTVIRMFIGVNDLDTIKNTVPVSTRTGLSVFWTVHLMAFYSMASAAMYTIGAGLLRYLRFVVLAVMVIALPALVKSDGGTGQPWFCEWICPSGTLSAGIPLVLLNAEFQEIIGFRFFWKVAVLVVCVLVSIWYYRPFCKYLCPLGAFYGVFNPVSMYRLEVDANKCIKCGACQRACGMDIPTFQTPNSMDCIRCGDCVAACPTGAIESTLERIESQLKDRFIADEDVMTEPVTQSAEPTKATVIHDGEKLVVRAVGVLLIVGGLTSMAMSSIHGVFNDFDMHFTIEALSDAPYLYTGLNIMKVFASLMVFMTGVYLMRNADRAERVKTASEKLGWAYVAYLVGVAMFIVALVLNTSIISLAITDIINFFCLLCLPILWRLAAAITRRLNGDEGHVRLVILLVLAVVSVVGYAGWSTYNVVHFFNVIMTM